MRSDEIGSGEAGETPDHIVRVTSWQDLLRAMASARPAGRRFPHGASVGRADSVPGAPRRSGVGGCLVRLVLFAVLLVFLMLSGLLAFGISLFQVFRPF